MTDLVVLFILLYIALVVVENAVKIWKWWRPICADCGGPIGEDGGPVDGWQMEDGRTVCQSCCGKDLCRLVQIANEERNRNERTRQG